MSSRKTVPSAGLATELLQKTITFVTLLPLTIALYFVSTVIEALFGEAAMPSQLKAILSAIRKKPTVFADGRTEQEASGQLSGKKTAALSDLSHLGLKNTKFLAGALPTLATGEPINDKELLLENGVSMLQGLPLNSGLSEKISNAFINMLWEDLPHPATTLAGPTARYRRHDGGNNNPWAPEMGKAGTPYSRSVPPMKPKGPNLPDPESVFEALLRREDGAFRKHPSGLNRLFFSFATVVIHECFQTSRSNPWINETSSYVDLSTLYGNTEKEQKGVRTYSNGLIYPDAVASDRIMMMPPGVVAVMILLSRNHNKIAQNLLSVNEDGKYGNWDDLDETGKKWQDEDIFQLSRNINVGYFASVVLHDYVAAILNTPRANSEWSLDLGKEFKEGGKRVERGTGNVVSVEFAVLYHWHAALSAADAKWMEDIIRSVFPDLVSVDDLTPLMFKELMGKYGYKLATTKPKDWTFSGLHRGPDGRFNDADLSTIIKSCIEEPAHEFGAHGTPASLKIVDVLGQLQARNHFNVCTLNEFRKYLNLTPYDSFDDWNSDPKVSRAAELLYGNIDNLELYPGLMAECTKPAMPGSGVCPGQTTGRGILNDAVALVRGDRFLSYDMNSNTLTHWGASKIQNATAGGAYGGVLPTLIFNALPNAFPGTSSYALLPFYTPEAAKGILKGNKVSEKYNTAHPPDHTIVTIKSQEAIKKIFDDRESFKTTYQTNNRFVSSGADFLIGWNDNAKLDARSTLFNKAFFDVESVANTASFFSSAVGNLIKKNSLAFSKGRHAIDIVRDVVNIAPVLFVSDRFAIPLKTPERPTGLFSIYETFSAYQILFLYLGFDVVPANTWKLREGALKAAAPFRKVFEAHLKTQVGHGFKEGVVDWLAKGSAYEVGPQADRLYHDLAESKLPVQDLAADVLNLGVPIVGFLSQQAALIIDLYLKPKYEKEKNRIIELAQLPESESEKELQGFVFEGIRLVPVLPAIPRTATKSVIINDGANGDVQIQAGDTVLLATSTASVDPSTYPDPTKIDPLRPITEHGLHFCFAARLVGPALAATLRQVFKLRNIRRAPGKQGEFLRTYEQVADLKLNLFLDASSRESPVPSSLTLEYDA